MKNPKQRTWIGKELLPLTTPSKERLPVQLCRRSPFFSAKPLALLAVRTVGTKSNKRVVII